MLKNSPLPILDVHRVLSNDISLPIVCSHISYRVTCGIVNPAKCGANGSCSGPTHNRFLRVD
ncbi:hypothetical protein Hanom_Chr04g00308461 [Helianthus anomalus]